MLKKVLLCVAVFSTFFLWGQKQKQRILTITKKQGDITLDGVLDEKAWQNAALANDFTQRFPSEFGTVKNQTEVRLTYDDTTLYIGVKCEKQPNQRLNINSLKRDFSTWGNDAFVIRIDPFQDKNNAFFFNVSPYGVQGEGIISNGGNSFRDASTSWDSKWYNKNNITERYWVSEIAIPFNTLRFKKGAKFWNINFLREDTATNQTTCWTHVPRNFSMSNLNFAGKLHWETPLEKTSRNLSLIPYTAGSFGKDYSKGDKISDFSAGGDIKYALTPALNLDLTFNPDFSQVEVDRQVTNLSRFEVYLPERRQFFLENSDLFDAFGDRSVAPFFSRRIGMIRDAKTRRTLPGRILYGVRLTGKTSLKTRIGLLNTHTLKDAQQENHAVFAVQHKLSQKNNTNIGVMLINKQQFSKENKDFNRVGALDYNYSNTDNSWQGKASFLYSLSKNQKKDPYAHIGTLRYSNRNFEFQWLHRVVGAGFESQTGFIRRTNYKQIAPNFSYRFFYDKGWLNTLSFALRNSARWGEKSQLIDRNNSFIINGFTRKNQWFTFALANKYIFLRRGFDISRTGGKPLPANSHYQNTQAQFEFSSDKRRAFSYALETGYGEYYNGRIWYNGLRTVYNYIPKLNINITSSLAKIYLPLPYTSSNLWLTNAKFNYSFNKDIHLMAYFQYNSQSDFMGVNLRFQWRFAPASDLFLVYNDSYINDDGVLEPTQRAIMAKLTYWLNI